MYEVYFCEYYHLNDDRHVATYKTREEAVNYCKCRFMLNDNLRDYYMIHDVTAGTWEAVTYFMDL